MKYTLDAQNKRIGRLATEVAVYLMGKNLTTFQRNNAPEVKVEIKNASKLLIDGKKKEQKRIIKKMNQKIEEDSTMLIHVLQFEPPPEKMLEIDLPKKVLVLDFKKTNNPLEN